MAWVTASLMPRVSRVEASETKKPLYVISLTKEFFRDAKAAALREAEPAAPGAKLEDSITKEFKFVRGRKITEKQHWDWLGSCVKQLDIVKPGMTRKALFERVSGEGGISTRTTLAVVSKHCPYLKLRIIFAASGSDEQQDKIKTVTGPYLQYMILD